MLRSIATAARRGLAPAHRSFRSRCGATALTCPSETLGIHNSVLQHFSSFGAVAQKVVTRPLHDPHFFLASARGGTFSMKGCSLPQGFRISTRSFHAWQSHQATATPTPLGRITTLLLKQHSSKTAFKQHQPRGSISSNNALQRFTNKFSGGFSSSSNPLVYSIVAINVAVFAVWQYAEGNAKRYGDPRLYIHMLRNFTDSAQNLRDGRVWTLLTSAFSHKEWYHILLNCMVLLSFGDPVWRMLGARKFMAVYLGSAIAASLSSVGYYEYMEPYLRKVQNKPISHVQHVSMGASGAIMGITTAFACVHPFSQYSLFFVINMPAAALIGLFGVYELYNVLAVNTGRFDSAGHLGGGLFGAAYYLVKLRPWMRRMGRL